MKSDDIALISEHLGDAISKEIFSNRLLYSLTDDMAYIKNVIRTTDEGRLFQDQLMNGGKKKLIFGAGIWGREIMETYRDVSFIAFVDNAIKNRTGFYNGLPVLSFDQYRKEYRDELIVIATKLYHEPISRQLKEAGVREENILNAGKMIDDMSKRQYFDLPELRTMQSELEESFVDVGSFDGRTSALFAEWCQGNYRHIWAFEPDQRNLEKCEKTLSCLGGTYDVFPKGLWDSENELCFSAVSNGGSKILEAGEERIQVVRLDRMIQDKVTFIKMDIEGAEYKALLGSTEIIKRDRPKLAISIYHKAEDMWEIPLLILRLNPEYRLFLRHYSIAAAETVIYAV